MKNLESYPIPARPFVVAETRIEAAMLNTQLLKGIFYDREAKLNILGADQLPFIQPIDYTYTEKIFPGAKRSGQDVGNTQMVTEGKISYFVGARAEYGLIRRSDEETEGTGALEWVGRLQDAIETDQNGVIDAFLDKTLAKPLTFTLGEHLRSQLAFILILEVHIFSVAYARGGRSA